MDNNKIAFIICYNDPIMLDECSLYINTLNIPDNMSVQIISVDNATSMTEGYQAAMQSSNAKYKIYLHQDVFILNENFIEDILDIFSEDDIGMIGMVGSTQLPSNAVMWQNKMRYGVIRVGLIYQERIRITDDNSNIRKYKDVKAIDGLLMATSVDIPWRTDLFNGWHFYDISQSMEFIKKGYRIVVPYQNKPWCLHDMDVNLDNNKSEQYQYWQRVFLDNYGDMI